MKNSVVKVFGFFLVLMGYSIVVSAQAGGDNYPSRAITVVTTSSGSSEAEMRMYTERVGVLIGKPVILDYKGGAGGVIGTNYVAKAKPDGYTLLGASANFTTSPAFFKDLPFDPISDFSPVSILSKRPTVLMVHPSLPVTNAKEYFEYA